MTDGTPIYPIDYKYFNPDSDLTFSGSQVIIGPGEPYKNLAEEIDNELFKKIKKEASKALNFIKLENYDKVFNIKGRIESIEFK